MNARQSVPAVSARSKLLMACVLICVLAASCASDNGQVTGELTGQLQDFLAAAPRNEKQVYDNFFADDVIYTRSAGVTIDKAAIMKNLDGRAAGGPAMTFEADNITVHPYGNMAVVNFRLVIHSQDNGKTETSYNRNTGTFLKRNGKWQVVAWQSTKVPPEDVKAIK